MRTLWKALLTLFLTLRGLINEARFPQQLGPRERGVILDEIFFGLPVVDHDGRRGLTRRIPARCPRPVAQIEANDLRYRSVTADRRHRGGKVIGMAGGEEVHVDGLDLTCEVVWYVEVTMNMIHGPTEPPDRRSMRTEGLGRGGAGEEVVEGHREGRC